MTGHAILVLAFVVFLLIGIVKKKRQPEKIPKWIRTAASRHKRRARLLGIQGADFSPEDFIVILKAQGNRCIDCKKKTRLTIAHLRPLSRNGNNSPRNIAGQCFPCNLKQSTSVHRKAKRGFWDRLNGKK
jgi:5-methylcytosine-specific restriction endonuclease McrA